MSRSKTQSHLSVSSKSLLENRSGSLDFSCIHPISSCLPVSRKDSPPRWTQKRGFPAAAILALLILAAVLLVIAIKLIYHQLDLLDRRHSLAAQQSTLFNQTDQPSPIVHSQGEQYLVEVHRDGDEENQLSILFVEKTG